MRFVLLSLSILSAFPAKSADYQISRIFTTSDPYNAPISVARLNDIGQVVGTATNGLIATAFIWDAESGINWIPTPTQTFTIANGINNLGQVVGQSDDKPYIWSSSEGFKYLRTPSRRDSGAALVISENGQIAGYVSFADGQQNAAVWETEIVRGSVVGAPPNSLFSGAGSNGIFVGFQHRDFVGFNDIEAITWSESLGLTAIGTLGVRPGQGPFSPREYSNARDSNSLGVVVGYSSASDGERAFWWTEDGGIVGMTDLAGGIVSSRARSINHFGQVVGIGADAAGHKAVLWNSVLGEAIDLNSYLSPGWGWTLTEANDVNERGQIIGTGFDASGAQFAWIMSPVASVPEPAAWSFMVFGFGLVGGSMRLKLRNRSPMAAA